MDHPLPTREHASSTAAVLDRKHPAIMNSLIDSNSWLAGVLTVSLGFLGIQAGIGVCACIGYGLAKAAQHFENRNLARRATPTSLAAKMPAVGAPTAT